MSDIITLTLGGAAIILIIAVILAIASIVAAAILLCLVLKEKGELKVSGVDELRIKKITNLSIWSLVIMMVSCLGCAFLILPILSLVFGSSNAKTALKAGNIVEATKKADLALIMLVISNSIVVGLPVLITISNLFN